MTIFDHEQWHDCYNEIVSKPQFELTDQECFCYWMIKQHQRKKLMMPENLVVYIFSAVNEVYQAPVFETVYEVEYALKGLVEKEKIKSHKGLYLTPAYLH